MNRLDRSAGLDEDRLDDPDRLAEGDPGDMLRQVASSAAQIRTGLRAAMETDLGPILSAGRPRAVVVCGMGGSGIVGDVLAAVCGSGCPVPVVTVRSYQLPGWVGGADLVVAVSCSGGTEETLELAQEAARRGSSLLAIGGPSSPLADLAARTRATYIPVRSAGMPRATLWGLAVPAIHAAERLGLVRVGMAAYEATATALEEVAHRCRPTGDTTDNPGKRLAAELVGTVPMIWGSSPLTGVAALRFACQLNENAKYPAVHGVLPEANHNQVVALDGPYAGPAGDGDFFRDRVEESDQPRLRLVLLRDAEEHPQVARRREASVELARERGVGVSEVRAEGGHALERLARLVALTDYASVYLALAYGIDPTPVTAIDTLKRRIG